VLVHYYRCFVHKRPELAQTATELVGCFEALDLRYAGADIHYAINQVE
jgi:hypothetical protein